MTVPKPDMVAGNTITCRPATVAVLAPTGIVLATTPSGKVTVPPTLSAGVPPIFAKLTVPPTTTLMATLAGTVTLVTTSAGNETGATLNVLVLFSRLVSFSALVVPVPATPVEVCKKLIEALTVALGLTLTVPGAAGNVTKPVAGV